MIYPLGSEIVVSFEYTDAHLTNDGDASYCQGILDRCVKLCEVFDFEFELIYQRVDQTPHSVFKVSFNYSVLSFQHNMNVLAAFAQDFQINMTQASVSASEDI